MTLGTHSRQARAIAAFALALLAAACGGTTPGGPQAAEITVTAVSPSTGSSFGGTTLTITGTGFSAGATVTVGGTAATDVTFNSSTSITAKTPAHIAGAAEVKVSAGGKSGALPNAFTYVKATTPVNTPPVVGAIAVTPQRASQPVTLATIGDRLTLTVSVNDAETPTNSLTYEWTSNPSIGTFSGTGPSVQWTAPSSSTSPQTVLLLLTVIEKYQEADAQGLPVNKEHRIQQSITLKVHDSVREIGDMALDFLTSFSKQLDVNVTMQNFSRTCDGGRGYNDEFGEVLEHKNKFTMTSYNVGPNASVTFAYGSTVTACEWPGAPGQACAKVPVVWSDIEKATGKAGTITGNDYVSAVYEGATVSAARWFLCHSKFEPLSSTRAIHPFFHLFIDRGRSNGPVR